MLKEVPQHLHSLRVATTRRPVNRAAARLPFGQYDFQAAVGKCLRGFSNISVWSSNTDGVDRCRQGSGPNQCEALRTGLQCLFLDTAAANFTPSATLGGLTKNMCIPTLAESALVAMALNGLLQRIKPR